MGCLRIGVECGLVAGILYLQGWEYNERKVVPGSLLTVTSS